MNIFEWFIGAKEPKTEAEIYMEQRNREYARKAAMYKTRELISGRCGQSNGGSSITNNLTKGLVKVLDEMVSTQNITNQKKSSVAKTHTTQTTNNNAMRKDICFAKDSHNDDVAARYAEANSSEFIIANNVKSGNTLLVFGEVTRGGFETGDTVLIHTKSGSVKTKITTMAREKSEINYVNSASGTVRMLFVDLPNQVSNGDKIVKSRFVK